MYMLYFSLCYGDHIRNNKYALKLVKINYIVLYKYIIDFY